MAKTMKSSSKLLPEPYRCRVFVICAYSTPREEGWTRSGRGGRSQVMYRLSDHPVCGAKVGFAEIFLMPQPPLLTRRGMRYPSHSSQSQIRLPANEGEAL